tara:strand:- start:433 stop:546 length:114 start_codon:yes stop_codon:yes gene_type:complete
MSLLSVSGIIIDQGNTALHTKGVILGMELVAIALAQQ